MGGVLKMISKIIAMSSKAEARKRELEKLFSPENRYKKLVTEEIPGAMVDCYKVLLKLPFASDKEVGALQVHYSTFVGVYVSALNHGVEDVDRVRIMKKEVEQIRNLLSGLIKAQRAQGCRNYTLILKYLKESFDRLLQEGPYIGQYIRARNIEDLLVIASEERRRVFIPVSPEIQWTSGRVPA